MNVLTDSNDLPAATVEPAPSTAEPDEFRQRRAVVDAMLRDFVRLLAGAEVKRFSKGERGVTRGGVLAWIAAAALAAVVVALGLGA